MSWIGESSKALVTTWGYPDKQITAPDGNTVYIYHKSRTLVFSQTYANDSDYYNSQGTYTNTQIEKLACTTWFAINRKTSIIGKVFFKGNLCMAGGLGSDHPISLPLKRINVIRLFVYFSVFRLSRRKQSLSLMSKRRCTRQMSRTVNICSRILF